MASTAITRARRGSALSRVASQTCTGSACFIARLSLSVENVDCRREAQVLIRQDALDAMPIHVAP
jgi:hypothetical protein